MKNKLTLTRTYQLGICLFISLFFSSGVFATVHTVSVSSNMFSPNNLAVNVGDTIVWNWINGSHTTTADAGGIPAGAATWNAPMTSSNTSFMYKITVAGTYNYYCIPHQGAGMVASFTASPTTATPRPVIKENAITVYPNPFLRFLTVDLRSMSASGKNVAISIYDMLGNQYYTNDFILTNPDSRITLDLDKVRPGIYFINIMTNDKKVIYRLVKDAPTSKINPVAYPGNYQETGKAVITA